jgi:hypothetical protein
MGCPQILTEVGIACADKPAERSESLLHNHEMSTLLLVAPSENTTITFIYMFCDRSNLFGFFECYLTLLWKSQVEGQMSHSCHLILNHVLQPQFKHV